MSDLVKQFNRIGVEVDSAEKFNETIEVTLRTLARLRKLSDVCPTELMGLTEDGKASARVNIADLEHAIATNARPARRAGGVKVDISSETVYTVNTDENAVNDVTEARWDSKAKDGYIVVNDVEFQIHAGRAEDHYDIGEESDPDRPVYFVMCMTEEDAEGEDPQETTIVSYGIKNLIRSIASFKYTISK